MNPLSRIRSWWHQPVLGRLDAIERNTRRETVTVTPPRMHIKTSATASELAKEVGRQVRATRRRSPSITHGICGWCERTVELVVNNGEAWLADHAHNGRTCIGSGSDAYQPAAPEAVS